MSILSGIVLTVATVGAVSFTLAVSSNVRKNKDKAKLTFDELVEAVGEKIDKYIAKKANELKSEYIGGKCEISMSTDEFVSVSSVLYFKDKSGVSHQSSLNYNIPISSVCTSDDNTSIKLKEIKVNPLTFNVEI